MRLLPETVFRRILLAHFAATCAMAGVIWIVQLVIYPQFSHVGAEAFPPYHAQYTGLVTLVVGPLASVRAEDEGRSANRASSSLELTFKKKNSGAQ
jgi:hypothetical protein